MKPPKSIWVLRPKGVSVFGLSAGIFYTREDARNAANRMRAYVGHEYVPVRYILDEGQR